MHCIELCLLDLGRTALLVKDCACRHAGGFTRLVYSPACD